MSDINDDKNIEIELGGGSLLPKRDEVPDRFKWKGETGCCPKGHWFTRFGDGGVFGSQVVQPEMASSINPDRVGKFILTAK